MVGAHLLFYFLTRRYISVIILNDFQTKTNVDDLSTCGCWGYEEAKL